MLINLGYYAGVKKGVENITLYQLLQYEDETQTGQMDLIPCPVLLFPDVQSNHDQDLDYHRQMASYWKF